MPSQPTDALPRRPAAAPASWATRSVTRGRPPCVLSMAFDAAAAPPSLPRQRKLASIDANYMHLKVACCCPSPPALKQNAALPHSHQYLSRAARCPFDARGVAKRFRRATVFGAREALPLGETVRLVNDPAPLPRLDPRRSRYGERTGIAYPQREPFATAIDFAVRRNQTRRTQPCREAVTP